MEKLVLNDEGKLAIVESDKPVSATEAIEQGLILAEAASTIVDHVTSKCDDHKAAITLLSHVIISVIASTVAKDERKKYLLQVSEHFASKDAEKIWRIV